MLYPNPRGSTGYGEKFTRANIMDWGGGDYRDIMTGVDDMVKRGIADSTKMAFEGWSYGGYMTAWVVSQTSRFKAARMGAGLSDLQSMYGTTDIPGYIGTFFSGIPTQKTLDFYRARSAITFVDQVTTPLLILHGGSDERVPIGQSMEYYRALKDRGKTGAARVLSARRTRARRVLPPARQDAARAGVDHEVHAGWRARGSLTSPSSCRTRPLTVA